MLKIGDNLELTIVERDPRCKVVTLDPDNAEATPKLLRYLARNHGGNAGVFAVGLQRGQVNKGDPIFVICVRAEGAITPSGTPIIS